MKTKFTNWAGAMALPLTAGVLTVAMFGRVQVPTPSWPAQRPAIPAQLLPSGPAPAAEASLEQVLAGMRANLPPLFSAELRVEERDRDGRVGRDMRGHVYIERDAARAETRTMLRLSAPAELSGTALLAQASAGAEDEMYLFMPAIRRVRKISGEFAVPPLLGSGLSYARFRQIEDAFLDAPATLGPGAQLGERAVYTLDFTGKARPAWSYSRMRALVDRQTGVPLRVELYQGDELRQLITAPAESLRQAGGYWYAAALELRDLATGSVTSLRFEGVDVSGHIAGPMFDPQQFYASR